MAQRDSKDPEIQFKTLGGLNERPAPNALDAPDFAVLDGMYPSRDGWLERLPGIQTLATITNNVGIWSIHQANDGTDNIIVQLENGTEQIYTLTELFNRTADTISLDYTPIDEEETMSQAIMVTETPSNVDGGVLGANANQWYKRTLSTNTINENGIILSFSGSTFQLGAGTYRIEAIVVFGLLIDALSGSTISLVNEAPGALAALYNETDSSVVSFSTPGLLSKQYTAGTMTGTGFKGNVECHIKDSFTIAGTKTFSIQGQMVTPASLQNNTSTACGFHSNCLASLGGVASKNRYLIVEILKTS